MEYTIETGFFEEKRVRFLGGKKGPKIWSKNGGFFGVKKRVKIWWKNRGVFWSKNRGYFWVKNWGGFCGVFLGQKGSIFGGFWRVGQKPGFLVKNGGFLGKTSDNWVFWLILGKPPNSYSKNVIWPKTTKSRFRIGI